jgi:hypothetical protein
MGPRREPWVRDAIEQKLLRALPKPTGHRHQRLTRMSWLSVNATSRRHASDDQPQTDRGTPTARPHRSARQGPQRGRVAQRPYHRCYRSGHGTPTRDIRREVACQSRDSTPTRSDVTPEPRANRRDIRTLHPLPEAGRTAERQAVLEVRSTSMIPTVRRIEPGTGIVYPRRAGRTRDRMTTHNELAPDRHRRMHLSLSRALRARDKRRRLARKAAVEAAKAQQVGPIRRDRINEY